MMKDPDHGRYRYRLAWMNRLMLIGFLIVVLAVTFWGSVRVNFLAGREDNPRTIEQELRVKRGRILDANEVVLAQNEGSANRQERVYPLPVAEPVIGYYSLRYGTAGVEEALDPLLRGETSDLNELFAREVLNQTAAGTDIRLTLDIGLQANAVKLLAGRQGAAVLLSLPEGAVRAMVSLPTFDPNELDSSFDLLAEDAAAPLINRATQGRYQPGLILQPFLLAVALDQLDITTSDLPGSLGQGNAISDLLQERWDGETFLAAVDRFGLLSPPSIPIPVGEVPAVSVLDLEEALRGEESLTVSPLQIALATAILGMNGQSISAQLVSGVRVDGRWQAYQGASAAERTEIVSAGAAAQVRKMMTIVGNNVQEYATTVPSGPELTNSWYIGLSPPNAPRYVVVVVLEANEDEAVVSEIGRRLLELALK